jgi:hypothetical protein
MRASWSPTVDLVNGLLGQIATIVGLMAGGIAVGGFLGHARPSLNGESDAGLRRATTLGGLVGLGIVGVSIALSFVVG